jgi:hypothetical protein
VSDDGKTFDGIKTGKTRGRTQTPSGKRIKRRVRSLSDFLRRGPTAYRGYLSLFMANTPLSARVATDSPWRVILTTPPYATSICTTPLPCLLGHTLCVRPILPVGYISPERSSTARAGARTCTDYVLPEHGTCLSSLFGHSSS